MSMPKGRFNIRKLAKLFYEYSFFDDYYRCKTVTEEVIYDVLLTMYSTFDTDTKDRLILEYESIRFSAECEAKRNLALSKEC